MGGQQGAGPLLGLGLARTDDKNGRDIIAAPRVLGIPERVPARHAPPAVERRRAGPVPGDEEEPVPRPPPQAAEALHIRRPPGLSASPSPWQRPHILKLDLNIVARSDNQICRKSVEPDRRLQPGQALQGFSPTHRKGCPEIAFGQPKALSRNGQAGLRKGVESVRLQLRRRSLDMLYPAEPFHLPEQLRRLGPGGS
jgi:hypothetical protein